MTKEELRSLDSVADTFCESKGKLAETKNSLNIETFEGSWHDGIKTLEEKRLVHRRCGNQHGGEKHKFSLTRQGTIFVEELLRTQDSAAAKTILEESKDKTFYTSLDPKKVDRISAMKSVTRAPANDKKPAKNPDVVAKGQMKMTSFFSIKK